MSDRLRLLSLLMWLDAGLTGLLALILVCTGPVALLEGEELGVVVLGFLLGVVFGALAGLQAWAASMVRQGRGRAFAIVVMSAGQLKSCFCGGLSVALLIFGLIVLLDPRMREGAQGQ